MVQICEDCLKPCAEYGSSLVCQVPGGLQEGCRAGIWWDPSSICCCSVSRYVLVERSDVGGHAWPCRRPAPPRIGLLPRPRLPAFLLPPPAALHRRLPPAGPRPPLDPEPPLHAIPAVLRPHVHLLRFLSLGPPPYAASSARARRLRPRILPSASPP